MVGFIREHVRIGYSAKRWHRFKASFFSEYFTDGLRNTLTIVTPLALLFYLGYPTQAVAVSMGTLLISLTDLPGNRGDKFRSALVSITTFFLTALLVSRSVPSVPAASAVIVALTFVFSMMAVFGPRMGLIGLMSTILAIFILGIHPGNPFLFGLNIVYGALWYYAISLLQVWLYPYRSIHHALHDCLETTIALMRLRAGAYDPAVSLKGFEEANILLHLELHNRQEQVRNLLLTDKHLMRADRQKGRRLLAVSQDMIDLYEQVTAIHYDYPGLRAELVKAGVLTLIRKSINHLADALEICRPSFLTNRAFEKMQPLLIKMNQEVRALDRLSGQRNSELLKRITVNLDTILTLVNRISAPSVRPGARNKPMEHYYTQFLSTEKIDWTGFRAQLSIHRPVFRFALRLSVLCLASTVLNFWIPAEHYSYWFLLTVIIVNRPSFGITWQRNRERLTGTLLGLAAGFTLIHLGLPVAFQLIFSAMALLGFFVFNRFRYDLSVGCITLMIVFCLNVLRGDPSLILADRLIFTLAGCVLSLVAAFIFPIWEAPRIKSLLEETVLANRDYLAAALDSSSADQLSLHRIRLARKTAYLKFAALTEALQSLRKEPGSRRFDIAGLIDIQILCYHITARIAARSISGIQAASKTTDTGLLESLKRIAMDIKTLDLTLIRMQPEIIHSNSPYRDLEGLIAKLSAYMVQDSRALAGQ